jgi:hypothetical protein
MRVAVTIAQRQYGWTTVGVISSVDVMEVESLRASQRILFMADECSHCREELARLKEENAALRRAAIAFGSLAERLNATLLEERRSHQPRLTVGREGTDQRTELGQRGSLITNHH